MLSQTLYNTKNTSVCILDYNNASSNFMLVLLSIKYVNITESYFFLNSVIINNAKIINKCTDVAASKNVSVKMKMLSQTLYNSIEEIEQCYSFPFTEISPSSYFKHHNYEQN